MTTKILTQERLMALLHYNPETGVFTRLVDSANRRCRAGETIRPQKSGRVHIGVDGRRYLGTHLAWLYIHGKFPAFEVDHINVVSVDDRKGNLRDVPHALNVQNVRTARRHSKTGVLGVVVKSGAYYAQITINGRTRSLGRFDTKEAAHAAYVEAKRKYHPGNTL